MGEKTGEGQSGGVNITGTVTNFVLDKLSTVKNPA